MALRAREQTGEGQYVDVAMQDCMISAMSSNYMTYLGSGVPPKPLGTSFPTVAPYRVFQARDRGFAIAVGSEKLWSTFCGVIGRPDLENDPEFATNALRCTNRPALERTLGAVFIERDAVEWIERLRAAGIPCTPVRNFEEVASDPQSEVRQMFPRIGSQRVTGTPVKLSATPGRPGRGAPHPGENTRAVLEEVLGIGPEVTRDLMERGIVFAIVDEGCVPTN
jgi:crotonobetainyl-CoA:carnitine CoA-transferase CaiB-like acyl-CoA transferase